MSYRISPQRLRHIQRMHKSGISGSTCRYPEPTHRYLQVPGLYLQVPTGTDTTIPADPHYKDQTTGSIKRIGAVQICAHGASAQGVKGASEPCPHSRAEPWLPPHKELVHITIREPLVGLSHSLEVLRPSIIAEPLLAHRGAPASIHRGSGAPATSPRRKTPRPTALESAPLKRSSGPADLWHQPRTMEPIYHLQVGPHQSSSTEPHALSHAKIIYARSWSIIASHHEPRLPTPTKPH